MLNTSKSKIMATLTGAALLAVSTLTIAWCANDSTTQQTNSNVQTTSTNNENIVSNNPKTQANIIDTYDASDHYASGTHHATLNIAGYDPITITLDADSAPITVSNFCKLANSGYYNGMTFYRFQDGFCMQGGTKGNTASGNDSSLTPIKGEFKTNGVTTNKLSESFGKGTVAMARTQDKDSATSTFFITLGDAQTVSTSLNGQYAAFGTIDSDGMKIVDKIVSDHINAAKTDSSGMGMIKEQSEQVAIESIVIED